MILDKFKLGGKAALGLAETGAPAGILGGNIFTPAGIMGGNVFKDAGGGF